MDFFSNQENGAHVHVAVPFLPLCMILLTSKDLCEVKTPNLLLCVIHSKYVHYFGYLVIVYLLRGNNLSSLFSFSKKEVTFV